MAVESQSSFDKVFGDIYVSSNIWSFLPPYQSSFAGSVNTTFRKSYLASACLHASRQDLISSPLFREAGTSLDDTRRVANEYDTCPEAIFASPKTYLMFYDACKDTMLSKLDDQTFSRLICQYGGKEWLEFFYGLQFGNKKQREKMPTLRLTEGDFILCAKNGNIAFLKEALNRSYVINPTLILNKKVCVAAAEYGSTPVLFLLCFERRVGIDNICQRFGIGIMNNILYALGKNHHIKLLERFIARAKLEEEVQKRISSSKLNLWQRAMHGCASGGVIEHMEYLNKTLSLSFDEGTMSEAICGGHFSSIKWLLEDGHVRCTIENCVLACANGHLNMLKLFFHHKQLVGHEKMLKRAIRYNQVHIMRWFRYLARCGFYEYWRKKVILYAVYYEIRHGYAEQRERLFKEMIPFLQSTGIRGLPQTI